MTQLVLWPKALILVALVLNIDPCFHMYLIDLLHSYLSYLQAYKRINMHFSFWVQLVLSKSRTSKFLKLL